MAATCLEIYRYQPGAGQPSQVVRYTLPAAVGGPMVLDALHWVKDHLDPTLAFRRSCREGICGSCAMNIDGHNTLACLQPLVASGTVCRVYPLPHLRVIKDLVVDLTPFYQQYAESQPWLQRRQDHERTAPSDPHHEHLQTTAQRAALEGTVECILCACCATACPSYWWQGGQFLGPATLLQVWRWLQDSRDEARAQRLARLDDAFKLYRCHTIFNCTQTCPKQLNPAQAIAQIKRLMLRR